MYKPKECTSDRICGIDVLIGQKKVLSVFGVYLPHDDHSKEQCELYIEILHELQGYIDACESVPNMVVGDFNTRLPQTEFLQRKWFGSRQFGRRSVLLYDFICDNNMYVVNFSYPQKVNYTYQNSVYKSYIDHMLLPRSMTDSVISFTIHSESADNMSDHFAVSCCLNINAPK